MAKRRDDRGRKRDSGRDGSRFAALPHLLLDCDAFRALSFAARALLLEMARQYVPGRNGQLLCSASYLRPRGWSSSDTITRAKAELLAAGFIYETCKGGRPNRASLYALTWYSLDGCDKFDHDAARVFRRGAYLQPEAQPDRPKNASLTPTIGATAP